MVHDDLFVHGQGWTLEFTILHLPEAFEKIVCGNGQEAHNYSLLGTLYLCRTGQHPPEMRLKHRRGSRWASPPVVKNYTAKSTHTQ